MSVICFIGLGSVKPILKSWIVFSFIIFSLAACGSSYMSTKPPIQPQTNTEGYIYVGDKLLVGEIESVIISPLDSPLNARIDTGATTSSLDARNIAQFERDGEVWVRFDMANRQTEEVITIERPLVRHARIMQSNTAKPETRPVVLMSLTLADRTLMVEFSLSNRSHLTYPVLIGRNVIKDILLVDVGQKNIAPPKLIDISGH